MCSLFEKLFIFTYILAFINPHNCIPSDLGISNMALPPLLCGSVSVVSGLNIRKFKSKNDEVTGEWRKLHQEELHNMYVWPDIL
jgi:hypothetical protein